ncbi:MAG: glycosyltransferase [Planctomycetes bacterium]|nr:glycosyltransferase [Planctomycetota bacterium]
MSAVTSTHAPIVSIVLATFQRCARLQRCVAHVRQNVAVPFELIVVDGGSDDGTREWLATQPALRTHLERQRAGCCRAYNFGFRMARGLYVMWLNDDAFPLPGAVENAVMLADRADMQDVGLVAFYHNHQQPWNELHGVDHEDTHYGILHVRGRPYANFGLLRRELLEELGYLDESYYFCAWDPDLSLKVQCEAGLKVLGAPKALVYHEELADERKQQDAGDVRTRDNERLFAKWGLPAAGAFPDPRPAYLDLIRQRGLA